MVNFVDLLVNCDVVRQIGVVRVLVLEADVVAGIFFLYSVKPLGFVLIRTLKVLFFILIVVHCVNFILEFVN